MPFSHRRNQMSLYHLDQCCSHDNERYYDRNDTNFSGEHKVIIKLKMCLALFIQRFCIHDRYLPGLQVMLGFHY